MNNSNFLLFISLMASGVSIWTARRYYLSIKRTEYSEAETGALLAQVAQAEQSFRMREEVLLKELDDLKVTLNAQRSFNNYDKVPKTLKASKHRKNK